MVTINQIRKYFNDFADGHFQLKDFGYGDFPDISMERAMTYPIMWVQPLPWRVSGREIFLPYKVAIADRVYKERGSQETEVHSDTALIALDLLASMNQQQDYDWELDQEAGADPFTQAWKDEVSGHLIDVTFKIQWNYDACQIPQAGQPDPPPTSCAGVIININDVLYGTAASGDTESIEVRNGNGVLVGSLVAGIWVVPTAGDATAVVKNSAGTTLVTETIPSGTSENIVIGDVTITLKNSSEITVDTFLTPSGVPGSHNLDNVGWTDSDGTLRSTPYGDPIACIPATPQSGIFFIHTKGPQYTSYEDEDDGYLVQNGFYTALEPSNPQRIPRLDFTQAADYFLRLTQSFTIDGVSSLRRFRDRDGNQVWPATGNKNLTFIDVLTGLEWYRDSVDTNPRTWAQQMAFARSHSITIDGEVCADWIMPTIQMFHVLLGSQPGRTATIVDNSVNIFLGANLELRSSTTYMDNTGYTWVKHGGGNGYSAGFSAADKTVSLSRIILCRKANNLISV